MIRNEFIQLIYNVSKKPNAFDLLEKELASVSKQELSGFIIECGILPEMFQHDSSEEKLWAKYSDIVLAKCLTYLGIESTVLRTRGNSADVYGKASAYTIVGDAKTFRLSRTAKNQKDFKVKALDDWRREDTYAVLVSPLLQYPTNKSQIYSQAIERNVTLMSYTHLKFLLDTFSNHNLEESGILVSGYKQAYQRISIHTHVCTGKKWIELCVRSLERR
jgi:HindIII-like restriction endonuclease